MEDLDPDTAAELRLLRAQSAASGAPHQPSAVKRLLAWLARKDAAHDHNAGVRASRRRWRIRRRDNRDWQRHHGGSP